jgi:hypothetical protein
MDERGSQVSVSTTYYSTNWAGRVVEQILTKMNIGTIKGFPYTATLFVGDQCGGVSNWNTESCVELFNTFVDGRCEQQWPSGDGLYQCKLM